MKTSYLTMSRFLQILEMLAGAVLSAAAFGLIIIPEGFASAGVTGLSEVVSSVIPVSVSVIVLAINLLLLLLGTVFVGKAFLVKTVTVSVLFPVLLEAFLRCSFVKPGQSPLFYAILAGILLGTGAGLIIRSGASSGGFDVLAVILNRRFKVKVAVVMNICDAIIILIQAMNNTLSQTLYGILVISVSALLVNLIVTIRIKTFSHA